MDASMLNHGPTKTWRRRARWWMVPENGGRSLPPKATDVQSHRFFASSSTTSHFSRPWKHRREKTPEFSAFSAIPAWLPYGESIPALSFITEMDRRRVSYVENNLHARTRHRRDSVFLGCASKSIRRPCASEFCERFERRRRGRRTGTGGFRSARRRWWRSAYSDRHTCRARNLQFQLRTRWRRRKRRKRCGWSPIRRTTDAGPRGRWRQRGERRQGRLHHHLHNGSERHGKCHGTEWRKWGSWRQ